jgi:hypothetical protein
MRTAQRRPPRSAPLRPLKAPFAAAVSRRCSYPTLQFSYQSRVYPRRRYVRSLALARSRSARSILADSRAQAVRSARVADSSLRDALRASFALALASALALTAARRASAPMSLSRRRMQASQSRHSVRVVQSRESTRCARDADGAAATASEARARRPSIRAYMKSPRQRESGTTSLVGWTADRRGRFAPSG